VKSYNKALAIIDSLPWPVGFKYALSNDVLHFIVYRDNVREASKTVDGLVHLEKQINNAMLQLKSINPGCKLVVK